MRRHPGRDRLQLYLADGLDDTWRRKVERHVKRCDACQAVLEELTEATDLDLGPQSAVASSSAPGRSAFFGKLRQSPPGSPMAPHGPGTPVDSTPPAGDGNGACPDAPADARPIRPPAIPGYEILGELGSGGMGVVYRAAQPGLDGRVVALKMIRSGALASAAEVARFRREAAAAARLDHRSIVKVYEFGEHDGQFYYSMDLVEGRSLAEKLESGPLPPATAATLIRRVARAVHYAHENGVIHRDLTPGNILVGRDWHPRVTDFGLAKRLDASDCLTVTDQVVGTPSYMPPEQAMGRKTVGPAADVYALGATLYACLTGRPPFQAATPVETLRLVVDQDPVPVRRLNPKVDRDLQTICMKCLRKEIGGRYASAAELAADLERWRKHEPIKGRPIPWRERVVKWVRRHLAIAALLGLLILVSATGVAVVLLQNKQVTGVRVEAKAHREQAEALRGRVDEQQKRAEAERGRADARAAVVALDRGLALAERGSVARGVAWMGRALALAPTGDAALQHSIRANLAGWTRRLNPLRAMIPVQTNGTRESRVMPGEQPEWARSSPDGQTILVMGPRSKRKIGEAMRAMRLWSTVDGAPVGGELVPPGLNEKYASSADIRYVLLAANGGTSPPLTTAHLWSTAESTPAGPPMPHDSPVAAGAFSPDGRLVATGCLSGRVRLWSTADAAPIGEPWKAIESHYDPSRPNLDLRPIEVLRFSPDGRTLLVAGKDATRPGINGIVRLFRVPDGTPIGDPVRLGNYYPTVVFSPDSQTVLIQEDEGQRAALRFMSARDGSTISLSPAWAHLGNRGLMDVAISPTGSRALRIFSGDIAGISIELYRELERNNSVELRYVAQLWNVAEGHSIGPLLIHPVSVTSASFSPDGRYVLTVANDGTVRVWNAEDGTAVGPYLPHPKPVRSVAMSADGKTVLTVCRDGGLRLWEVAQLRDGVDPKPIGPPLEYLEADPNAPNKSSLYPANERSQFSPDGTTYFVSGLSNNRGGHSLVHLRGVPDRDQLRWPLIREDQSNPEVFLPERQENLAPTSPPRPQPQVGGGSPPRRQEDAESVKPPAGLRAPATLRDLGATLNHPNNWQSSIVFHQPGAEVALEVNQANAIAYPLSSWKPFSRNQRRIWSVSHRFPGWIHAASFSRDGRILLTGGDDQVARLWSTEGGTPIGKVMKHEGRVTSVAFSPDGQTVLTGSEDRTARLWSAHDGTPIGPALLHPAPVRVVGFSPDGRHVVTSADDQVTRTWEVPSPMPDEPERIALWTELITGMQADESEEIRFLDARGWQERRQRLSDLGGPPQS
jgi:WD40 repeat protein